MLQSIMWDDTPLFFIQVRGDLSLPPRRGKRERRERVGDVDMDQY